MLRLRPLPYREACLEQSFLMLGWNVQTQCLSLSLGDLLLFFAAANGTTNGTNGSAWALGPSGSYPNITNLLSGSPPVSTPPANGASAATRIAAGTVVALLAAATFF